MNKMKLLSAVYGRMMRKGQFKIQQMAFMLLAVVLFFVLVALFWLAIQYRSLHKQATQLEQDRAILISEFLTGSSEFSCAREEGAYCLDSDKLMVLKNKTVYAEFWPVAYIKIRKIDGKTEKECSQANYPNCNFFRVYENKKVTYGGSGVGSFVALCRYEKISGFPTRICELGKIIIGYEVK